MRRLLPLAATLAALMLPAAAAATVPAGFVGVSADGPALVPGFDYGAETALMAHSGVQSVRMQFSWGGAQPYPNWNAVPVADRGSFVDEGGVPTTFDSLDRLVALTAQRGLGVLPVVQYPPGWGALHPGDISSPPSAPGPYAAFLGALVRRYGQSGTFWATHPAVRRVPIRSWQIWNEPELPYQWTDQPFARRYVALLKAAHAAIKAADPHAQVVLAGLTNESWKDLGAIYRRPGARRAFDAVAANAYTRAPAGVITILSRVRAVMRRYGDQAKPLYATELGWPASVGQTKTLYGYETTRAGQASRIGRLLPLLGRNRGALRLRGFYLYTWIGQEAPGRGVFDFSGLRRQDMAGKVTSKPALAAFTRAAHALQRP
jgi:hypothetical protein